jgi:23S rRNA G2069 N7-methylase RlmK/C1962 C5-methylase RlmI
MGEAGGMIELLNCDCMDYMATLEDDAFDLACVDPPYGIERFNDETAQQAMEL